MKIFLVLISFAFGLFYEFTSYFAQIFILILLAATIIKNKEIKLNINVSSISLFLISIAYLVTCMYAVDKGMAILGFLKFTIPITFAILLMQYDEKQVRQIIDILPAIGIAMIIVSVLFRYLPFLPDEFYLPNGRMGGLFQYSNTFALYLLIGIIVLLYGNKSKIKKIIGSAILLFGILATGSRAVFILTILNFIIFIVKFKNMRKNLLGLIGAGLLITLIYVAVTNNFTTFGRFITTSFNSSTMQGRFLYYKDAIPVILSHPFGLGYMGYSYIQSSIQTGIYSAVYIHNDLLQICLDVGIIPFIIFTIAIIKNIANKQKFDIKKQILLTLLLHFVIDFDLQFLVIFIILIMMLNLKEGKEYVFKTKKLLISIILLALGIIYTYFGVCTFLQYISYSKTASDMYPCYTEANLNILYEKAGNDLDEAYSIATKIENTNTYIDQVYNIKAVYDLENGEWEKMVEDKQKAIEVNKYDMNNYNEYVLMLSKALEYYVMQNDIENTNKYIELILQVPEMIEELKKNTSDVAYNLRDIPNFDLFEEVQNYIDKIKEIK